MYVVIVLVENTSDKCMKGWVGRHRDLERLFIVFVMKNRWLSTLKKVSTHPTKLAAAQAFISNLLLRYWSGRCVSKPIGYQLVVS